MRHFLITNADGQVLGGPYADLQRATTVYGAPGMLIVESSALGNERTALYEWSTSTNKWEPKRSLLLG